MMQPTFFDIETTAIDDWNTFAGLTKIHCLVIRHGEELIQCSDDHEIQEGLHFLKMQDVIVGHNVMNFDIPAIQHLYPAWHPEGMVRDTRVLSRLAFPDQRQDDFRIFQDKEMKRHIGSYSLKAWGHRLGVLKGDYGQQESAWDQFTPEMLEYCTQDVNVTKCLYHFCMNTLKDCEDAIALEHVFHGILRKQELRGFGFDSKGAADLYCLLKEEQYKLKEELEKVVPPDTVVGKKPAYWYIEDNESIRFPTKSEAVASGYRPKQVFPGPPIEKKIPFNPDSRPQIARYLIGQGWQPTEFTPGGDPKIDETTLKTAPGIGRVMCHYLMISKRVGQLSEGESGLMRFDKNGRIHGVVQHIGTATSRCSHSNPNVAQVPAVRSPYGKQFRSLFIPTKGLKLVGIDASGLELRCLAHYLHHWDGGKYADIILNGDIHVANQEAAGLETRDQAKTFIYGFIYGAGPKTVGAIIGGSEKDGKEIMKRFTSRMPALAKLQKAVVSKLSVRPYVIGLDNRRIPIRSKHSALNFLLQSAGAIIMKQATVDAHTLLKWRKVKAWQVAHVHDEIQFEVDPDQAELCGQTVVEAIRNVPKALNVRCPLDGEFSIGDNWAETH
jgi:DNA polymerase-1